MLILTVRSDKPEAELGLYENDQQLAYTTWQAHRQLAETIHTQLKDLLESQNRHLKDVQGIVLYKGPGSFTGLRIGFCVANALADSLALPIVSTNNDNWINSGLARLQNHQNEVIALPEYGSPPHITQPKH